MSHPTPSASKMPLALTQGDPSGIGPEIAMMAWLRREATDHPFFILSDPDFMRRRAESLGWNVQIAVVEPHEAMTAFARALPVVPLSTKVVGPVGQPDAADAASTLESIERAVAYVHAGHAKAVVTNPIAKDVLYRAGFSHPGHTEYLGVLAEQYWGTASTPVMLLWSQMLAVVPVTVHIPLSLVPQTLTSELIIKTAHIVAQEMQNRFGVDSPRLALAGLNPHAGENGTIGMEERDIIIPAIALLREQGLDVSGPHPADALFHESARQHYDVVLAMYHDQALIPIKTLAFDDAVNVTLGLPFIRTSPDHGTAFGIAGRGIARPDSLMAALSLASRLSSHGQSL